MAAMQRKLPIANGSFLEAQFQSFDDPSAVIHHGQHRAQNRHRDVIFALDADKRLRLRGAALHRLSPAR
jgi:hypothetical protein